MIAPDRSGGTAARARVAPTALAWWNAAFFTLLCASETGFMAAALDWGLTGLLDLPPVVYLPLSALLAAGVVWSSVWACRLALAAERDLSA